MRRLIRVVALTCGLAVVLPCSGRGAEQTTTGEAAVRETVTAYVTARERADAAALSALFTDDADQLTSSGEWRRGREELVRGTLASSKSNAGTRTITIQTVRFATADVAIADGEYVIAAVTAVRNMLPASPAQ